MMTLRLFQVIRWKTFSAVNERKFMTVIESVKSRFPKIYGFLSADNRKTSILQDFLLCCVATLTVTFYVLECSMFQNYISVIRLFAAFFCVLVWAEMCFVNGIRRRPWFMTCVAVYWIVPNIIIYAFNHLSGYSLVLDVLMQYSRLLVGYPIEGIASGMRLSSAALVLIILACLSLVFLAGMIVNPPEKKH